MRTQAQNDMADIVAKRGHQEETPDEQEAAQQRAAILDGLRGGTGVDVKQAVTDAIRFHQLTPPDVAKLLKRAGISPATEKFKSLTLPQAMTIFKEATPREQGMFRDALLKKIETAANKPQP